MNIKELTAHIRSRIKHEGIAARVRIAPGGGQIQVFVAKHGLEFSEAEQRAIKHIAICNKLTWARKMPIIMDQITNPYDFNFYP